MTSTNRQVNTLVFSRIWGLAREKKKLAIAPKTIMLAILSPLAVLNILPPPAAPRILPPLGPSTIPSSSDSWGHKERIRGVIGNRKDLIAAVCTVVLSSYVWALMVIVNDHHSGLVKIALRARQVGAGAMGSTTGDELENKVFV